MLIVRQSIDIIRDQLIQTSVSDSHFPSRRKQYFLFFLCLLSHCRFSDLQSLPCLCTHRCKTEVITAGVIFLHFWHVNFYSALCLNEVLLAING